MPIKYKIDRENRIILEEWIGDIFAKDLQEYWTQYLKDPEVLELRRTIVDLRQSRFHSTGAQLNSLIESIVLPVLKDGIKWKTAIVVDAPAQFGMSRQYQVFAQLYSKDAIFYSMEEAQSWLVG